MPDEQQHDGDDRVPLSGIPIFQAWFFWGIIPDCPASPTGPCMVSRTTGTGGTVILTFKVPAPWDPLPHGGS